MVFNQNAPLPAAVGPGAAIEPVEAVFGDQIQDFQYLTDFTLAGVILRRL